LYISTRGNIEKQTSAEAIALGMVPYGGLFVPDSIPSVNWQEYKDLDYSNLALRIMKLFLTDLPDETIKNAVSVYGDGRFDTQNPVPLVDVGTYGFLELWRGPTAAFKDIALQVLPYLLTSSIRTLGLDSEVLILTATSGDTGKAALEGFKDVPGTRIVVFYPAAGVSHIQELQMTTTRGQNTHVVAVNGNFDQCQTAVKKIFGSEEIRKKFSESNIILSSANSINWGRLLPQIVYYFWAYLQAVAQNKIGAGEEINVVVPTGNFGNILAAYYAKRMGLPIANLICASNKNNVLADFFNSGIYNSNRPFYLTYSPSMDILISSNFERFIFEITDRDEEKVSKLFSNLATDGIFEVDSETLEKCRQNMIAGWAQESSVLESIDRVYKDLGYVLDPHTAVGWRVYMDYREKSGDNTYTVITSTASPFKFANSVLLALKGDDYKNSDPWQALNTLSDLIEWKIPAGLKNLQSMTIRHTDKCEPEKIPSYILAFA